jgi:CBS domain containing-hemolysin-like protein
MIARAPEETALRAFGAIRLFSYLLWPIVVPLQRIAQSVGGDSIGAAGDDAALNYESLRFLLKAGEEEGVIEREEQAMIASIFEFGETLVREVMVPRIDIVAIDAETSLEEAVKVILEAGHSRIPVYRENIDNIIGLLYAKDLLQYFAEGRTDVDITKILRPAYFVPETKKVDELLQELQQRRVHMAIVVDEYGGTAGLVTIEDLLEEIVGEIQDEYDAEEPLVEEVNENEFVFNARVDLDEVNKRLRVELPNEGGDTLGGFIYSQLGRVPRPGEVISFNGLTLEVLTVEGQRIGRVRVRREAPPPDAEQPPSDAPAPLSFLIFR